MRVPAYDQSQETPRALPGVKQETIVTPGLVDAGAVAQMETGKALEGAGAAWGVAARRMQERQDADMVFRAETAVKTDYLDFENQVRERKGQNAWGSTQDAAKWWEDKTQEHAENLENDTQRKLFQQQAAKYKLQSLDTISKHEADERKRSLDESAQASIVSSINLASANYTNPDAVAGAKSDILKRTQVLSQLNGWSPELRDAKQADYLTNFHSQIIQNQVDKDPVGAKAYYEANKAEINGSVQDKLDKVLKIGGMKTVAQQYADQVEAAGLTEQEAITGARKKFEGEQEDHAVLEVKTRFREKVEATELRQKKAGDTAWDIYAKTKNLNAVPASVINEMDGKVRLALEQEARDAAAGTKVHTDPGVYYDLRKMAVTEPDRFQNLDLRAYFPKLDEGDREKFIDLQHPGKLKEAATLDGQLSNMHDQMGWGASDKDKKGNFDRVVTQAISAEQKQKGKDLTFDERQKVIDRMVIQGKLQNSGVIYDTRGKYYEFAGQENANTFVPKVPDAERTKIEAALTRAKRPVTDAEVLRLYRLKSGL